MSAFYKEIDIRRKKQGLSQEEVAKLLGVSRPTYCKIENGEKELTLSQAEKLAALLRINVMDLLESSNQTDSTSSVTSVNKYKQMIQAAIKFGADGDGKITKTKLAKLIYLSDFIWYYETESPMSGMAYRKLQQGPVANLYFRAIDELEESGFVSRESCGRAFLYSLTENADAPSSLLTEKQLEVIRKICEAWHGKSTDDIVQFTHAQLPWQICNDGEVIPYGLIFQEEPEKVYGPVKL